MGGPVGILLGDNGCLGKRIRAGRREGVLRPECTTRLDLSEYPKVALRFVRRSAELRWSEGRLTPELSRRPAGALVARGLLVRTVAAGAVLAGRLGRARTVTAA